MQRVLVLASALLLAIGAPAWATVPRDAVVARVLQLAAGLPSQIGPWRAAGPAQGDGILFSSVAYRLGQTPAYASVFISHPLVPGGAVIMDPVPDGPDSALAEGRASPPGPAPGPTVQHQTGTVAVPNAPSIRCGIVRQEDGGRRFSSYRCATGVAGVLLVIRVTAPMPNDDPQERNAVDSRVAELAIGLVSHLARAAARR